MRIGRAGHAPLILRVCGPGRLRLELLEAFGMVGNCRSDGRDDGIWVLENRRPRH